jgi:hypothetical protein
VWEEVKKHHRYLMLIAADGANSGSVRMLSGVHLLTVQTMLMWVLALCYDVQVSSCVLSTDHSVSDGCSFCFFLIALQFPRDTGACSSLDAENSCLAEKSRFDAGETLCDWRYDETSDTHSCKYTGPSVSIKASLTDSRPFPPP